MGGVTVIHARSADHHQRVHGWGQKQRRYERAFDHAQSSTTCWQQGHIAFLKPEDAFTADEHTALIKPRDGQRHGYLPPKATGHPIILLSSPSETSTHVLVTPVSAYSSGAYNNFLPPWKQAPHQWKKPEDFRSFNGCERFTTDYPFLLLRDGKTMPKPRASWLYIQSLWVVPLSVIGRFNKTRHLLQVQKRSLSSLLTHMEYKCKRWKECTTELAAYERAAKGLGTDAPTSRDSWREQSPCSHITTVPPASRPSPPALRVIPVKLTPASPPSLSKSWASIAASRKASSSSPAAQPLRS